MRIGIFGAGAIADLVTGTLSKMEDVELWAVAARDLDRAQAFADKHGFRKAYGSYEELANDDGVELVYIATIHPAHAEQMKLCINAGKPVLCEKAFTINAKEAREVLALSKEKGVFVGEAMWVRYLPTMVPKIREIVNSGIIGKVTGMSANLGYRVCVKPRVYDPMLGGSSLLDLGVYSLNVASICFGNDVESFTTDAILNEQGVDLESMATFIYRDGRRAYLSNTSLAFSDRNAVLYGEAGHAVIHNINNYEKIEVFSARKQLLEVTLPPADQISGYEYQFRAAYKAIQEGKIECDEMPHSEILAMMDQMDALRERWGFKYPWE